MTTGRTPREALLELIEQATIEEAVARLLCNFTDSIIKTMRREKVGLEPAINKVRDFYHAMLEVEPLQTEVGETVEVREELRQMIYPTFEQVAYSVRNTVAQARELVALADQGEAR